MADILSNHLQYRLFIIHPDRGKYAFVFTIFSQPDLINDNRIIRHMDPSVINKLSLICIIKLLTRTVNQAKPQGWHGASSSNRERSGDSGSEEGKESISTAATDNVERVRHLRRECQNNNFSDGTKLDHLRYLIVDEKYKMEGKEGIPTAEIDNMERVQHLHRECKHHHFGDETKLGHLQNFIVDEKYKLVFCYIPKIACSQWKTIFITLTGKVNASVLDFGNVHKKYHSKMNFLSGYSLRERKFILEKYKKYVVVRNPFERLLSAYRNKFVGNGFSEFREVGQEIIKRFRKNATLESLKKGDDVTFLEFVQFLTDEETKYFDDHWKTYTAICHPCHVQYDFIGKYETISRDADFILRDIGAPPEIRFPKRSEKYSTLETLKTFETFYSQIPGEYIAKLYNNYEADFELFGYSLSDNFKVIPNT
ncbi:carbohydrate sulfotransferase 11-like [Pecten maximus]|uniref:carbohydrate sulfotransferase 11-like n=1 Tax=Pecten maximus TaxID=6579 RepID=UPI001458E34E|nr:carbohydrate sulfotransferase 11-like [Pecten maximus]